MNGRYILEGHTPVEEPDLLKWGRWLETADRHVADTEHELFRVSTVFLGLDHQFGRGPPILFETMVFTPTGDRFPESLECHRYATWEDAELGHAATVRRMLERAREASKPGARDARPES